MQQENFFSLSRLRLSLIYPDVNAAASSHSAASVARTKQDAVHKSRALAAAEGSDSTGVQERRRPGRSVFRRDLQSPWGGKTSEIRGTRGLPLQPRTSVRVSACTQTH